jgi:hypothetical protein
MCLRKNIESIKIHQPDSRALGPIQRNEIHREFPSQADH